MSPQELTERIRSRDATVGVIGLGYVGLPLCLAMTERGFRVIGFDIDAGKPELLLSGKSYIKHISSEKIVAANRTGRFTATTNFSKLVDVDAILICVPTPLTAHHTPDLTYVQHTAEIVSKHLRSGQLVILESTTFPGTTREVLQPILEKSGLVCGRDFFLAFSPEREDPGNASFNTAQIPKVVGSDDPTTRDMAVALYDGFISKTVPVSSSAAAEAVKITENIFRAVNIALVNELKVIYSRMGIDIWEVIDAAKTKPFGFMPFYPGPGLGGHCIPIDPFYLTWKAKEYGISTKFIELAGDINSNMPDYVVNELSLALDRRQKKGLNGSKILVVGLAYKKNIDDIRESPSLVLIELLEKRGATVEYYDPYVRKIPQTREHANLANRQSITFGPEIASYDAILIATDHDDVDYTSIVNWGKLVVDTRGACRRNQLFGDHIVSA